MTRDGPPGPCPFCGNRNPDLVKWTEGDEPRWRVVCLNCLHSNVFSESEAITAWNRAARPALTVERDALRAALQPFAALLHPSLENRKDDSPLYGFGGSVEITVGDIRRAAAVLGNSGTEVS